MRKHLTAALLIALTLIAQINWCEAPAYAKDSATLGRPVSLINDEQSSTPAPKRRLGACTTTSSRKKNDRGYELMRIVDFKSPISFDLKSTEPYEQALQVYPGTVYDILAPACQIGRLDVRYKDAPDSHPDGPDNLMLFSGDTIKIRNAGGTMDYYIVTIHHTDMMAALRVRERWLYGTKGKATYYSSGGYNISTSPRTTPAPENQNTNENATSSANPGSSALTGQPTNPRFRDAKRKDQQAPRPNPKQ